MFNRSEYYKKYYRENKEKRRLYQRSYFKKYYQLNKSKLAKAGSQYRIKHRKPLKQDWLYTKKCLQVLSAE